MKAAHSGNCPSGIRKLTCFPFLECCFEGGREGGKVRGREGGQKCRREKIGFLECFYHTRCVTLHAPRISSSRSLCLCLMASGVPGRGGGAAHLGAGALLNTWATALQGHSPRRATRWLQTTANHTTTWSLASRCCPSLFHPTCPPHPTPPRHTMHPSDNYSSLCILGSPLPSSHLFISSPCYYHRHPGTSFTHPFNPPSLHPATQASNIF